jgi:hypothetical protein
MVAMAINATDFDKTYFSTKGATAEAFVHELTEKSMFSDWCYRNPMLKSGVELCDMLIVFDNIVIIMQIKDLKLRKNGTPNTKDQAKNIKQLHGAYRQLMELKTPVKLINPRRGEEMFDPSVVKRVFMISILTGESKDVEFYEVSDKAIVHVFDREFTEIVMNELDTVADFLAYLDQKEKVLRGGSTIRLREGEKDFLAYFINQKRDLSGIADNTTLVINEDIWQQYDTAKDVAAKREADRISYAWDGLIEISYTSGGEYEKIAREFARVKRFDRRMYGEALVDGFNEAQVVLTNPKLNAFRRVMFLENQNLTVVICYYDDPKETKDGLRAQLLGMAHIARVKFPTHTKVIGIGSDITAGFSDSFTFLYFEQDELTKEYIEDVQRWQNQTKVFTNLNIQAVSADEYPSTK